MDGHFVPNITIGPGLVKALRPHTKKPFDVHLMISPVDPFLEAFADADANIITLHPEPDPHLHRTLPRLNHTRKKPAAPFTPATPATLLPPVVEPLHLDP